MGVCVKVLAKLGCTKSGIKGRFIPTIRPELHVVQGLRGLSATEDSIGGTIRLGGALQLNLWIFFYIMP